MLRGFRLWVLAGCPLLSATALGQPCPVPCNGTQVNCSHQNGIRNHRGGPAAPRDGPNGVTGNVPGDAEWKIWGCENGMTRGSGVSTFANWEIGASNNLPGGTVSATFDIPDLELRPVVVGPAGVKEPDLAAAPLFAAVVGTIVLPTGGFRINVIIGQGVALPSACTPPTGLPTLSNADVAMLFLHTPGEMTALPTYYRNFQLTTEANTISNPSVPTTGVGNSYSGTVDALLSVITHYAINQELYGEMGFFEPTLEILRQTAGLAVPSTGAGARELAAGDTVVFRSEDWAAGIAAIAGQSRMAGVLFSEPSGGNPLCQPGLAASFLQGSIFVPGSPGVAAIFPTPLTFALLSYSAWVGNGMNCHAIGDVACGTSGIPSVFSDMRAQTPPIVVPPGLGGSVLHAAALYFNATTLSIEDGSNTVELVF